MFSTISSPSKRFSEQDSENLSKLFSDEIACKADLTVATVRQKMKQVDFNVEATEKQIYDKVRRFIRSPTKEPKNKTKVIGLKN